MINVWLVAYWRVKYISIQGQNFGKYNVFYESVKFLELQLISTLLIVSVGNYARYTAAVKITEQVHSSNQSSNMYLRCTIYLPNLLNELGSSSFVSFWNLFLYFFHFCFFFVKEACRMFKLMLSIIDQYLRPDPFYDWPAFAALRYPTI